jgi:tetratricopeptide (TPR) repeat protein
MSTRRAGLAFVAGMAVAAPGRIRAADRPWVEVSSAHFHVVSNAGEKEARAVAWQFEQVRSVFNNLWPWARTDARRPFVVLAVRDEASLKRLAPEYWERRGGVQPSGVFVGGADRDFVAMRTDVVERRDDAVNPYSTAYAGYAHIVLQATFPGTLPLWYQRGLAEFFGNTVVRAKDVQVGRLIPWHMTTLAQRRLPLPELLSVDRRSPHYTDASRRSVYDAQSWMLVHYLALGENKANLPRFNRYSEMLRTGTDHARAFAEAFGDIPSLDQRLANYVSRRLYGYLQFNVDVNVAREGFLARTLSPAEAAAVHASFHVAMRRPVEARALIAEVRQAAPDLPASYEVEAVLLDREEKDDEAARAFTRAAELGSSSFHVHHRLAQLLWSRDPDPPTRARIIASLEKALRLHADSADAAAFLADMKAETAAAEALPLARRAVELDPRSPRHRLTLARVLGHAGQRAAAVAEAERALGMAREPSERKRAEELLAWLRQGPTP